MNYKRFIKRFLIATLIASLWAAFNIYFAGITIPHVLLRCIFAGFVLTLLSEVT